MRLPLARFRVADRSMEPVLAEGSTVLVNRLAYKVRPPRPGEIVVLRHPKEDRYLVKRVVAVGPEGVAVAGEDADWSVDSRRFGPVPLHLIVGRVLGVP